MPGSAPGMSLMGQDFMYGQCKTRNAGPEGEP